MDDKDHLTDAIKYAFGSAQNKWDYYCQYEMIRWSVQRSLLIPLSASWTTASPLTPAPQQYPYPGGITAPTKPSDGEIYITWDANGYPKFIHQWSDWSAQWIDVTAGNVGPYNSVPINVNVDFDLEKEFEVALDNGRKCECGAEKCGSNKHSTWCQKFEG